MSDVKPEACPWCGNAESLSVVLDEGLSRRVSCSRCCYEGPSVDHDGNDLLTEDDAVLAWNRRALPSPLPDAVCDRLIRHMPASSGPWNEPEYWFAELVGRKYATLPLARAAARQALTGDPS